VKNKKLTSLRLTRFVDDQDQDEVNPTTPFISLLS